MRTRSFILALTALLVTAGTGSTTAGQVERRAPAPGASLQELFEKAVFTEETMGDLDNAIAMYRQIIEQAEAGRPHVARAHLRLGLCYLKQGKEDEAVATLQKLVADFPTQQELVAQARARLAELGYAPPEEGVLLRQVWANGGGLLGSPSSDGRYLSFTDWSSGDLAIHDFKTGQDRRLTGKGSWATPSYAEFSVLSPNGRQIAYAWFAAQLGYDLRVIDVDGSEARVLYSREDTPWVAPIDWSPDGRQILSMLAKESGGQLAWVSLEDRAVRPVGPPRDYPDGKIDLSPDGRQVVYDNFQSEDTTKRDIFLIDIEGGGEWPIVEHPADDRVLGWSPDGRRVLFVSDRTGDWGAWAMRVADGKADGEPELLKAGLGQLWPRRTSGLACAI